MMMVASYESQHVPNPACNSLCNSSSACCITIKVSVSKCSPLSSGLHIAQLQSYSRCQIIKMGKWCGEQEVHIFLTS